MLNNELNDQNIEINNINETVKCEIPVSTSLEKPTPQNISPPESSLSLKLSKLNSPSLSNSDDETISVKLYDRLIEELKCPGCAIPMRPPVMLCSNGHSVCTKCMMRDEKCPLCKNKFTGIRSFTIEALCTKAQFRCSNSSNGCNARLPLDLLDWHEKQCQHKAIKCFMGRVWGDCNWMGQESCWKTHLEAEHFDKVFNEQSIELTWNIKEKQSALISYYVFNYDNETFNLYQVNDKEKLRILWTMATCSGLPGCRDKSYKFAYEVQIYRKDDESKIISQRFPCRHELDKDILQEGTCVAIPMEQISSFITEDNSIKAIHYRVSIIKFKCQPISNRSSKETSPKHFDINYKPTDFAIGNDKNVSLDMIVTKKDTFDEDDEKSSKKGDSDSETDSELDAFVNNMLRKRFSREYMTPNSNRKFWDSNYAYGSMQSLEIMSGRYDNPEGDHKEVSLPNNIEKLRKKSLIKSFRKSLKYFSTDK